MNCRPSFMGCASKLSTQADCSVTISATATQGWFASPVTSCAFGGRNVSDSTTERSSADQSARLKPHHPTVLPIGALRTGFILPLKTSTSPHPLTPTQPPHHPQFCP